MPRFSEYFTLSLSQYELDFVDVSNEYDTKVYVDPYAIEVQDDFWSANASESIRTFFEEVLAAIRESNLVRATELMSNLTEPKETFLGVSRNNPKGRGVGREQARPLITAIRSSKAYSSGILLDLSEVALYVDGVDRDKISDLTTNVIRDLLVTYTNEQCALLNVPTQTYNGPPMWNKARGNWISRNVKLPRIEDDPVLLVPKYIVRRKLSLDSQQFYNKQITDFLVAEAKRATSSLAQTVRSKQRIYKKDVREQNPKSKPMIAEMVLAHPELLELYKNIAKQNGSLVSFDELQDGPSIHSVCAQLALAFASVPAGAKRADQYHTLVMGSMTALFYPDLIQPRKEWEINDGRKRIDLVFTNSADTGFFAQRRGDRRVNANLIIVECKNYSEDLANPELDQMLGRFDEDKGKFGIITCRTIDNQKSILAKCKEMASRNRGYVIVLTDDDLVLMLSNKANLREEANEHVLYAKYREIVS